jgi:hypothetical protein
MRRTVCDPLLLAVHHIELRGAGSKSVSACVCMPQSTMPRWQASHNSARRRTSPLGSFTAVVRSAATSLPAYGSEMQRQITLRPCGVCTQQTGVGAHTRTQMRVVSHGREGTRCVSATGVRERGVAAACLQALGRDARFQRRAAKVEHWRQPNLCGAHSRVTTHTRTQSRVVWRHSPGGACVQRGRRAVRRTRVSARVWCVRACSPSTRPHTTPPEPQRQISSMRMSSWNASNFCGSRDKVRQRARAGADEALCQRP